MPASPQAHASQAKVGRIVGVSLAGLWLALSMLAAIGDSAARTEIAVIASVKEVTAKAVPVSN